MIRPALFSLLLTIASAAGCGPGGKIACYNPTTQIVVVRVGAAEEALAPDETRVLRWRGSPFTVEVTDGEGAPVETVEITPGEDDRWLFHHVGGDLCFGIADFGPLYVANTDGALRSVSFVEAGPWQPLPREMDVWPGGKLPLFTEEDEVWGMTSIPCNMAVDAANTHAAIHGKLDELKPR